MKFQYPDEVRYTAEQFYELFKLRCIEYSKGRLTDFSEASTLRVVAESEAIPLVRSQEVAEEKMLYAIADTIERFLKFPRNKGAKAVCTARFLLEAVYSGAFPVPRGHRFGLGEKVFETQIDLLIPGGMDTANPVNYSSCRVSAIAVDVGSDGNQGAQQASILQPIPGLLGIFVDEGSQGGQDEEELEGWFDRLAAIVAQANQRDTLIKEQEFEQAAQEILGAGSVAIAVPELNAQRNGPQIASMHLFIANTEGTTPTAAQFRLIAEQLPQRAPLARGRLYFSPATIAVIDIETTVRVNPTASQDTIATNINSALRSRFNIDKTRRQKSLDYYRAIQTIYDLEGVETALLQWAVRPDQESSADLPMPPLVAGVNETAPGTIGTIVINFTGSGVTRTFTS